MENEKINNFLVPSKIRREPKPLQMMGESRHLGSVLFTVCDFLYCMAELIIDLKPNSREQESDAPNFRHGNREDWMKSGTRVPFAHDTLMAHVA